MEWALILMFTLTPSSGVQDVINPEVGYLFPNKAECTKIGTNIKKKYDAEEKASKRFNYHNFSFRCEQQKIDLK